jgi:transcriptional regulator of nitric oxide reductase
VAFSNGETVERQTLFLTEAQVAEIQKAARSKVESQLVVYYRARKAEKVAGYAFFETSVVRTKPVTLMAVINPDSTVRFVELLSFHEPQDYLPAPRWLALFRNRVLTDNLWPKRDIHNITGATLSVQTITLAVRRLMAIYRVAVSRELKQ